MKRRESLWAGMAGVGALALLACSGTARATQASPSPHASPASGDVVDRAREGAEKAGEKIKEGAQEAKREAKPVAKEAGQKIKEGAEKTGEALDAAKQHLDVKTALLADKNIDASHIDIDIDKDTKTLYLRGTVPTQAQKTAAGRVARDKADGYMIRNELTVMAAPRK